MGGVDDHRYPLGNVFCALLVSELLKTHDWRVVFQFAAILSAVLFPVVWFGVPESISWLCRKPAPRTREDQRNVEADGTRHDRRAAATAAA